jgi:hypothetical protein
MALLATDRLTLSTARIHGPELEFKHNKAGVSATAPQDPEIPVHSLPATLRMLGLNPILSYSKAGMHGTEHRNRERRTPRLSAPRQPFSPVAGSVLQDAPQSSLPSGPAARDGLSLTRNGYSFRSLHSGVNVPGLPLRFQLAVSTARSAFLLCYPVRLAPVWAASLLLARCSFHGSLEDRSPSLHSPLGLLPPSGSKRSAGFAAFRPAFRLRPISLRSPPPVFYLPGSIASSYH